MNVVFMLHGRGACLFPVETFCGSPPIIESTEQVWNNNSAPGSTVLYICKEGFNSRGGLNVSICNENGQWTQPTLTCQGNSNNESNPRNAFCFQYGEVGDYF